MTNFLRSCRIRCSSGAIRAPPAPSTALLWALPRLHASAGSCWDSPGWGTWGQVAPGYISWAKQVPQEGAPVPVPLCHGSPTSERD